MVEIRWGYFYCNQQQNIVKFNGLFLNTTVCLTPPITSVVFILVGVGVGVGVRVGVGVG